MGIMLGVGTGRCGTVTLTNLINKQEGFKVSHETFHPIASWEFSEKYFKKLVDYLRKDNSDISLYNLPYVEKLWSIFPDLKVVCLKRNRDETIKSYIKKTDWTLAGAPRNHWTKRDSIHWGEFDWRLDPIWDKCYPKFYAPKEEAIGNYWDLYYDKASKLEESNSDKFRVYDMYLALNSKEHQADLLRFIGIKDESMKFILGEKYNSGS